jgi:hypothetical protein
MDNNQPAAVEDAKAKAQRLARLMDDEAIPKAPGGLEAA